ncbi:unnamed protein product [Pleuronectes platessa]|uniref:Uncharacterized protein n=1 Tax=Pleuronectes platessa TaxID=8262 RepID=A0A9N7VQX0_PLEPL|nr:unnamed protein product [Pleuronectes platessa]
MTYARWRKVRQGDGTDSSGVSTTTAADNASTSITTAGSSLAVAAETGQTELSPVTSPVDEILAAGNEPESAVQQRDDDEDSCRSLHGFVPVTPEAEAPRCAKAASRCFSLRCDRHKVLTWEWMGASCYLRLGAALKRPV